MSIVISLEARRNMARNLRSQEPGKRFGVINCQNEGQPGLDIKDRMKRSQAWLESGMKAEDICRCERAHSLGIIKREAKMMALFETPAASANALREVADEIEKGDAA